MATTHYDEAADRRHLRSTQKEEHEREWGYGLKKKNEGSSSLFGFGGKKNKKKKSKYNEPDQSLEGLRPTRSERRAAIKRTNDEKRDVFNELVDEWNACEDACSVFKPDVYAHIQRRVDTVGDQFEKLKSKIRKHDVQDIRSFQQRTLRPLVALRYDVLHKSKLTNETIQKWNELFRKILEIGADQFPKHAQDSIEYSERILDRMKDERQTLSLSRMRELNREVESRMKVLQDQVDKMVLGRTIVDSLTYLLEQIGMVGGTLHLQHCQEDIDVCQNAVNYIREQHSVMSFADMQNLETQVKDRSMYLMSEVEKLR